MHVLPFADVEDAKSAAHDLHESLHYYCLRRQGSGHPIGLQETYALIALALACASWVDLKQRLHGPHQVEHYAADWSPKLRKHAELAIRLRRLLRVDHAGADQVQVRLQGALHRCAFGCSPLARKEARDLRIGEGYTCEQIAAWDEVARSHAYHARYNYRLTPFEVRMLNYRRDVEYARIFGTKPPTRPRPRKADTL